MLRFLSDIRILALSVICSALAATGASAQTLTSDAADYPPGAEAQLTGAGFAANEAVAVQVVHADGGLSSGADHEPWIVTADDQGGFVTWWHVCEDDCVGQTLLATADGETGTHAQTTFTDGPQCGTGMVTLTSLGGSCLDFTPPGGNFNWEVIQGGSYQMTITNVTECTGSAITVFIQNSSTGNFCFNATGGGGTYAGTFTMPNPACFTSPISYKCGANGSCDNSQTFNALGPDGSCTVHLRASIFDADCNRIGDDTICTPDGCTPCTLSCPPNTTVDCGSDTSPTGTGVATGCADANWSDDITPGTCAGNYVITRHWSAPDGCGGTATCDQTITVEDHTAPSIGGQGGPETIDCSETPVFTPPTANDDCSNAHVEQDGDDVIVPGDCPSNFTITRSWVGVDDCGNTSDPVSQTITVQDVTPPTLVCPGPVTQAAGGACCVSINLGDPTTGDDCSEVTVDNDAPGTFCVGETVVTWTAEDACGNQAEPCTQTVTVLGQITAKKFYDANANGSCGGNEVGVAGWVITVTGGSVNLSGITGADGKVTFDVPAGTYTVSEGTPTETNWVHTTPATCQVTVNSLNCAPSCNFGNYCFSAPANGLTIGFWTNKNGEKLLNSVAPMGGKTWQQCLNDLACLRNANGTLHTFTNYADLKSWLSGATATNMAYMLSAQLAANILDGKFNGLAGSTSILVPGGVKTGANVCLVPFISVSQAISCGTPLGTTTVLPGSTACGCSGPLVFDRLMTVQDVRDKACCLLAAYGNTTAASTQRTYQECVKNILDMMNNNGNNGYACGGLSQYINPNSSSCPATFPK
jgi:hypothetical protein